jgi:homoserine O-acetyltransferase
MPKSASSVQLVDDALLGVLIEEVESVNVKSDLDLVSNSGAGMCVNVSNEVLLLCNEVEVDAGAHKLGYFYVALDYGIGHDAFLTHIDELSKLVGGFLGEREVKVMKWQERLYAAVVKMVRRGTRVLDIGCGDGSLLNVIRKLRNVKGDGVEIDVEKFEEAIADGNSVLYADVDDGLSCIPDRSYDTVVVSDTLQEVKNPRGLLSEALRIADEAIVTFPNFAAYRIRFTLLFKGKLPVSKQLPFEWYDTPNIHCITLNDFRSLCDKEGIEIVEVRAESRHLLGKILLLLGLKNLGASKIIARIRRRA